VILDRDGTLNHDRPDYVLTLAQLEILPGVPAAVARLSRAGYRVLVASVQACIGKGLLTVAGLDEINQAIAAAVAAAGGRIDGWYICPHRDSDGCSCRKPLPGLIHQAQAAWGFDPARTWVVGDAERDLGMARAGGCRPGLVLTGKGRATAARCPGVPAFADLQAAADHLVAEAAAEAAGAAAGGPPPPSPPPSPPR
jgi:D-glycero-D-manno-heptose 1,7-bisphosphate phosphatase